MESIRVRNLRSFADNKKEGDYVEIKPITVFVGKNSCGKSTLLRTFPLLRQSIESNTTGPILWYGDYVDFGSFKQALCNNTNLDDKKKIYFDFKTILTKNNHYFFENMDYVEVINSETEHSQGLDIELKLGVIEDKSISLTDTITINTEGNKIKLYFKNKELKSVTLNDIPENITLNVAAIPNRGLLPYLVDKSTASNMHGYLRGKVISVYFENTVNLLKNLFHTRTDIETIKSGLFRVGLCKKDEFITNLKSLFKSQKSFLANFDDNIDFIENTIYPSFLLAMAPDLINSVNASITKSIKNIKYIAPLRATAERYYRHQDLHVNEIDHTGSNLAIFLSRLSKIQLKQFQLWTEQHFGFTVHTGDAGLHHEIKIKINDDEEHNISDMGFGFSQILPIVASIWNEVRDETRQRQRDKKITFVIEQPELHLHPQFQNMLTKAFVNIVRFSSETKIKIRILFETHSNIMIDALGEAIEDGLIDKEDINIVIFNKKNGETNISFSSFSDDGYLTNWPIGFFSGR